MNIFAELSKNDFKMEISRSEDTQINRRESPETYLDTGKEHAKTGGGEIDKMDSLDKCIGTLTGHLKILKWNSRLAVPNMVATSYMWLFKFVLILKQNKKVQFLYGISHISSSQ